MSLFPEFTQKPPKTPLPHSPLAYRLAPSTFDDYVGQAHLLSEGQPLRILIEKDRIPSLILWGPPGCGKTSLSRLIATLSKADYIALNAVHAKVADIKTVIDKALKHSKRTLVFIDEIHRFSKLQQDALLPDVENGTLTLVGATTENPYFSVIPGRLSRTQVFELYPLEESDLKCLLDKTCRTLSVKLTSEAENLLLSFAKGDARKLITLLETAASALPSDDVPISASFLESLTQSRGVGLDSNAHYDWISALIKSMRASQPKEAIYWLARLLKGGEDPRFIARRLVIFSSEDIGTADSVALPLAMSAFNASEVIGAPEIHINLAHVVTYLAHAPKNRTAYDAIRHAFQQIDEGDIRAVPEHLRNWKAS